MLKLLDYQVNSVEKMLNMEFCILADEPGLGKTIQSISLINRKRYTSILIVCPATLKDNWKFESEKWLKAALKIQLIKKATETIEPDSQIIILNYDIVHKEKIIKQLKDRSYDLLICDEAHALKNPKSKRTKAVLGGKESLFLKAKQKLMLTGTPILNSPFDIYMLLRAGAKEALKPYDNFQRFTSKFCNGHFDHFHNWIYKGGSNLDCLEALIKPYVIRRLKKDVLKDFPEKFYQQIILDTPKKCEPLVKKEKKILNDLDKLNKKQYDFTEMATVRRELGEQKAVLAVDYIKTFLDCSHEKLVIFAHHKTVISTISKSLEEYHVLVIDGKTPVEERTGVVSRFQNEPQCRVILCNIKAGGVGITLTSASTVLFVELPWTAAEVHQAIDRCHRIGQTKTVLAQFLVFADSLDANIVSTILLKEQISNQLIKEDNMDLKQMQFLDAAVSKINSGLDDLKALHEKTTHVTKEDLRDVVLKLAKAKGPEIVKEVFEEYNAANLSDLSPKQYQAVYSVCSQALN